MVKSKKSTKSLHPSAYEDTRIHYTVMMICTRIYDSIRSYLHGLYIGDVLNRPGLSSQIPKAR